MKDFEHDIYTNFPVPNYFNYTPSELFNNSTNTSYIKYVDITEYRVTFIAVGVVVPAISVFGLLGNAISATILWRKDVTLTGMIIFMRCLLVTDMIILICALVFLAPLSWAFWLKLGAMQRYRDELYPFIIVYADFFINSIRMVNVWVVVLMAMERYISICHPFRAVVSITNSRCEASVAMLVILSLALNLPHWFAYRVKECFPNSIVQHAISGNTTSPLRRDDILHINDKTHRNHRCFRAMPTFFGRSVQFKVYMEVTYATFYYVFPVAILLLLNVLLSVELLEMHRRKLTHRFTVSDIKVRSEKELCYILVLITAIFAFCQTLSFLTTFNLVSKGASLNSYMLSFSNVLITFNSAINIVIHRAFGKKARLSFRTLLRYHLVRMPNVYDYLRSTVSQLRSASTFSLSASMSRRRLSPSNKGQSQVIEKDKEVQVVYGRQYNINDKHTPINRAESTLSGDDMDSYAG